MAEPKPAGPVEAPPAAALRDVDRAARVWARLHAEGRELHFGHDGSGRLLIELRDLDGSELRSLAPTEAVEIASGAPCASPGAGGAANMVEWRRSRSAGT